MANNNITKRLYIHGRVQGVSYRYWTQKKAQNLGLYGWVRNRADGSVEAIAHGQAEQVEALITACKKGPALASVKHIDVEDAEYNGANEFEITATV